SLTSSGAKAPRSSAMLHLLYRPGKAKRLASGKSKRFAVSHSQGNILMKKIVILITLLMLGAERSPHNFPKA
ncbi:hypothetical protein JTL40_32190, partial [Pseudomonas aeruginosa]|nr:hypothetical protein [Pseudomonas aeruginosa]